MCVLRMLFLHPKLFYSCSFTYMYIPSLFVCLFVCLFFFNDIYLEIPDIQMLWTGTGCLSVLSFFVLALLGQSLNDNICMSSIVIINGTTHLFLPTIVSSMQQCS